MLKQKLRLCSYERSTFRKFLHKHFMPSKGRASLPLFTLTVGSSKARAAWNSHRGPRVPWEQKATADESTLPSVGQGLSQFPRECMFFWTDLESSLRTNSRGRKCLVGGSREEEPCHPEGQATSTEHSGAPRSGATWAGSEGDLTCHFLQSCPKSIN